MALTRKQSEEYLALLEEQDRRKKQNRISTFYPDKGPLSREFYPKHMAFFAAGEEHRERAILAANRVGKSDGIGGYESSLHLTGQYPKWWVGRRFKDPVNAVAAGDTGTTVRDIGQSILLGPPEAPGTGLVPGKFIKKTRPKAGGIPDAIESAYIEHTSGGLSRLVFKSYAEGRESFQGTRKDVIWLDEEPPESIYGECLMRTMGTPIFPPGMILCTFTPLLGISNVVDMFLPDGAIPGEMGMVVN